MQEKPIAIRSVLLVCRRWNQLTCSTPTLWTNIESFLEPYIYHIQTHISYLNSAIDHSGNLPLDITVSLPITEKLWKEVATNIDPKVLGPTSIEVGKDGQIAVCADWFKKAANTCMTPFVPLALAAELANIYLLTLFGPQNTPISRIKTLTLFICEEVHSGWIQPSLDLFRCPAPILEQLSVIERDDDYFPSFNEELFRCAAPKLSRLCWRSLTSPESILVDGKLNHLRFWFAYEAYSLFSIRSITANLQTLFLYAHEAQRFGRWWPH